MKKLLQTVLFSIIALTVYSQSEQCATMESYNEMLAKDPSLKNRMEEMRKQSHQYVESKIQRRMEMDNIDFVKKTPPVQPMSLCGYNNTYAATGAAPSTLNGIVNITNFTGGDYVRLTGLIAGNTYRFSTCGQNTFNPQITIYTAGGGTAVAHNDDFCANGQSEIWFTPITSGSYDILLDEYPCYCISCQSLTMEVKLVDVPRPIITIPVVVHVFHKGEAIGTGTNISVQQIQSQITALNEDFRRLNSNISSAPPAHRGWSADVLIEFCLATRDPNGNATSGITRHLGQPSYTSSTFEGEKPSTIWDRDKYLNFWTCNFSGTLLGYAQFPNMNSTTDGVVIRYNAFGYIGNVQAPFHLGRTAVHEVGHWLDLSHVWGNSAKTDPNCDTDYIFDTPPQQYSSTGCPTFDKTDACSSYYPGIMFMNYMDYADDACAKMFTYGQSKLMEACLFGARSSLQTSNGCSWAGAVEENIVLPNIVISPNPSNGIFTITQKDDTDKYSMVITNIFGEVVYNGKITNSETQINLQNKSTGLYFIHLENGKKIISKKIVVEKN